jgi:hypothetical protein
MLDQGGAQGAHDRDHDTGKENRDWINQLNDPEHVIQD